MRLRSFISLIFIYVHHINCLSSQMYNVNWRGVCSTTQALYSISIHPVSSIQPSTTLGIPMRDENSFPFRWNGMITTNRHLWFMLSDWSVCFARTWTREIKHRTTPNWVFVCFRYNPAPSPSQALAMCRLPGWHENSSMNLVIHISDFKRIVMLCSVCYSHQKYMTLDPFIRKHWWICTPIDGYHVTGMGILYCCHIETAN